MDLLDLMNKGVDPDQAALDRLAVILARFDADDPADQDQALARAQAYCRNHWGSYAAGMEAYARRIEAEAEDPVAASLEALRWREEGEDPGQIIRLRRGRRPAGAAAAARAAVIARYGSEAAARTPTPLEQAYIDAATHLSEESSFDAFAPLAGWLLPWHPLPAVLADTVSRVRPLPGSVAAARAEALAWEERRGELAALGAGPGEALLPTACAARWRVVEDLWRRGLAAADAEDLAARLEYWAGRGGDDGAGYGVVLEDFRRLMAGGALAPAVARGETTREAALRLKADNPGWSLAMIGKELGISRQAVHKHLKKAVLNPS
jgi:hypothetical protein